jgi:alkylation response protein AidB-like acyl-CoA dehydrogenase
VQGDDVLADDRDTNVDSSGARIPAGTALLDVAVDLGATAAALDSFGVGEIVLERTTEYVKQRHQFNRPIGSFQAIKHRLADAVLLMETGRVAVMAAAEAVSPCEPAPTIERIIAASTAKAYVGDAVARICSEALQTHGGIGFTWEHDMHLYLKRVLLNQALYGTSRWHRRRVADLVLTPAG